MIYRFGVIIVFFGFFCSPLLLCSDLRAEGFFPPGIAERKALDPFEAGKYILARKETKTLLKKNPNSF